MPAPRSTIRQLASVAAKAIAARAAAAFVAAAIAAMTLVGCGQIGKSLGQQWLVVQFSPHTSVAAAQRIVAACSHVPNLPPAPVRPTADPGIADSARFNATNASDANMADLQICLQRFPAFQGVTLVDASDFG